MEKLGQKKSPRLPLDLTLLIMVLKVVASVKSVDLFLQAKQKIST